MKKIVLLFVLALSFSACKKENLDIVPDELGGTYRSVPGPNVVNLLSCVAFPGGSSSTVAQLRMDAASPTTATLVYQPNGLGILSEKSLPLTAAYRDGFIELSYQSRVIGDYRVGTIQDGKKERAAKVLSLMVDSPEEKVFVMFRGVKE
ncbi:MAG: hypothetical protein H7Y12_07285 [Sphingobacteriaceae bacterium]|nr:hypothetical protein [Cytophagaceae bacterium]